MCRGQDWSVLCDGVPPEIRSSTECGSRGRLPGPMYGAPAWRWPEQLRREASSVGVQMLTGYPGKRAEGGKVPLSERPLEFPGSLQRSFGAGTAPMPKRVVSVRPAVRPDGNDAAPTAAGGHPIRSAESGQGACATACPGAAPSLMSPGQQACGYCRSPVVLARPCSRSLAGLSLSERWQREVMWCRGLMRQWSGEAGNPSWNQRANAWGSTTSVSAMGAERAG